MAREDTEVSPNHSINFLTERADFISGLHEDVLWRIFKNIAENTENASSRTYEYDQAANWKDRPVIIVWSCAQVCHRWREFLLHSPSLWARLIDLDVFSVMQPSWKEEVMRRTDRAPLFIRGSVFITTRGPHEREFFLSILRDRWPRVESLRIRISGARELESSTWDLLFRPAPALRIIHLHVRDGFNLSSSHSNMHLFDDHAPLLESFGSWKLDVVLHPGVEWLSFIRRLDISYSLSMSINDWLAALKDMPRLERLCLLKALPHPPDTSASAPIYLPKLGEVDLNGGLRACSVFLSQIMPSESCQLYLSTFDEDEPLSPADLSLATKVLTRYTRNFIDSHNPSSLAFALYTLGFRISDKTPRHQDLQNIAFFIDISSPASDRLFSILQGPSSCSLDGIKTLELHTSAAAFGGEWEPDVIYLLRKLQSVESVTGDVSALRTLGGDDPSYSTLFPRLRNVKVQKSMGFEDVFAEVQLLLPFLQTRRDLNVPIKMLDFLEWGGLENVHLLDPFEDLKVTYYDADGLTIREHHCGLDNESAKNESEVS